MTWLQTSNKATYACFPNECWGSRRPWKPSNPSATVITYLFLTFLLYSGWNSSVPFLVLSPLLLSPVVLIFTPRECWSCSERRCLLVGVNIYICDFFLKNFYIFFRKKVFHLLLFLIYSILRVCFYYTGFTIRLFCCAFCFLNCLQYHVCLFYDVSLIVCNIMLLKGPVF